MMEFIRSLPRIGRIHVSSGTEGATYWVYAPTTDAFNSARRTLGQLFKFQTLLFEPGAVKKGAHTQEVVLKKRELAAKGVRALRQPGIPPRIKSLLGK